VKVSQSCRRGWAVVFQLFAVSSTNNVTVPDALPEIAAAIFESVAHLLNLDTDIVFVD
jgi:hypothetical protein